MGNRKVYGRSCLLIALLLTASCFGQSAGIVNSGAVAMQGDVGKQFAIHPTLTSADISALAESKQRVASAPDEAHRKREQSRDLMIRVGIERRFRGYRVSADGTKLVKP
jgi:hypothetical protein